MDVQRGHCWRCEKPIEAKPVHCKLCWIAVYCSQVCSVSDVFRHSVPECEVWGPKVCNNAECDAVGSAKSLQECTRCMNAWYCGNLCQQKDWSSHRNSCKKQTEFIQSTAQLLRLNLEDRYRKPIPYPYYIGNAIAVDMLNLKNNECSTIWKSSDKHPALKKDYSILSVGCGNLRNFIHTVASLPHRFQGKLNTTLNDFDPFMQARNVLFLFMMIAYAGKQGIAGILTTIWYSLHLSRDHYDFLTICLRTLAATTRTHLMHATQGIIDISEADLNHIKKVWQKWLKLECRRSHPSYINLQKQRQKSLRSESNATRAINEFKRELNKEYIDSYEEWLRDGIFLPTAEDRGRYLKYGNPTLTGYKFIKYVDHHDCMGVNEVVGLANNMLNKDAETVFKHPERLDFVYCSPPEFQPFGAWDHLLVKRFSSKKSLIDMYYTYIEDQILQTITSLKAAHQSISIIVKECTDLPRSFSQAQKFDRIFTSNIADYIGTKKLLSVFKHFLNRENRFATIVTQNWSWYILVRRAIVDDPSHLPDRIKDGSHAKVVLRALLDTGRDTDFPSQHQEYFNSIDYFVSYLRAELTACSSSVEQVATFRDVKESEGLRMRDFRQERNRVVPFQYRRNVRQVNMLRGHMSRMVEWNIQ